MLSNLFIDFHSTGTESLQIRNSWKSDERFIRMEKTINIRNFNTRSNQRIEIADNQENRLGQSVRICLFLLFVNYLHI